jgi:hypothetical protein
MTKKLIQICVNKETGKSIYLTDLTDGILSYRVGTEPKMLNKEKLTYEGDNIHVGNFFFHKSFLDDLNKK